VSPFSSDPEVEPVPSSPSGWARWRADLAIAPPILAGLALAIALVLLLQALWVFRSWSTVYGAQGQFVVEQCQVEPGYVSDRVECGGVLETADGFERSSIMSGSLASFGSMPPPAGATVVVYYRVGATGRAYPLEGRTTELARFIFGSVPLVFIVGGIGAWLAGWLLTNHIESDERAQSPVDYVFPQRFSLKRGGVTWLIVGLAWWLGDRLFVDRLLGTVGLG
jgi:hypothetical protein